MAEQQQHSPPATVSSSKHEHEQPATPKGTSSAKFPPPFLMPQQQQATPRRPSAEEMIDYYSRKGLDKQAASEKVIDDLQKALTLAVGRYPRKAQEVERSVHSVAGTLDSVSTRLKALEANVGAKPDLGGVFVAGVAAGGFLQAVPHVLTAVAQIARTLKDATASKP